MISFGIAASSHSGLIPLKTAYKKRGELLWAIASKKNFINLHSAAFDTVFGCNLVHALKISHFSINCSIIFFINSIIPRTIVKKYSLQVSRTLKTGGRLLNRASNITNFPPRFCVYKWASSSFTGFVFKFHMHVHN